MEADFSGWATKAELKCSDGRTIMPDAFKHQDTLEVPLVWQHDHKSPENVLGHVRLTNKPEGVWCDAFFNDTKPAQHAKKLVIHKDIKQLSIWANELIEKAKNVLHGKIREVSLVLAGANPGALIDPVSIRHGDDIYDSEDEAIIYTGLEFEIVGGEPIKHSTEGDKPEEKPEVQKEEKSDFQKLVDSILHADDDDEGETLDPEAIYESMNDEQKQLLHFMLGEALDTVEDDDKDKGSTLKQDDLNNDKPIDDKNDDKNDDGKKVTDPKGTDMGGSIRHNVFEATDEAGNKVSRTLTHDDMKGIHEKGERLGSLKEAVQDFALAHGIQDIEILFPDATTIGGTPEMFARRAEWVSDLMGKVTKRPFARIRTFSADLTVQEARAKGYVKGTLKKEEFFKVTRRSTTPTTIYKKQKLDRDDIIDITDFDVVAWLKAEMRFMLDEEIARAILVGDGRAADDEDKVDEDCIRPIASDHELYTHVASVNIGDSNSSISEALDQIVMNRQFLRGTGNPTLYTTETYIARFLLLKDNTGRKIYRGLDEVARDLRVSDIVPVEILTEYSDILGILVNPVDYVVGADRGGQVAMFDDFDIDYNQYKYLIETRMSGALVKLKAAMVLKSVPADDDLVTPAEPAFDPETGELTITNQTGVVYHRADTDAVINAAGSPYTVAPGVTLGVYAVPAAGYYFDNSEVDDWSFTANA